MLHSPSKSENWSVATAMTRRTTKHVVTVSTSIRILKIPRGSNLLKHSVRSDESGLIVLSF